MALAEPYDLVGFRLGMSLAEFEENKNPKTAGKAEPFCESRIATPFDEEKPIDYESEFFTWYNRVWVLCREGEIRYFVAENLGRV